VENAVLTGFGLAPAAGLNAYIPLLIFALADRFTNRVTLGRPYDFISSTAGIAILLFLLTIEIVADKVPGIDHANDLVQSAIRPAAGAILVMAATNHDHALNPVLAMIVGLLLAGAVHGVKATSRPAITISTGGLGNPLISMVEDAIAVVVSIMAIVAPIVGIVLVIVCGLLLWWLYRKIQRLTSFLSRSPKARNAPTLR
jgi:uncharacterized protein DUF4126